MAAVAAALDLQRRPERSLEDSIVDVLAGRSLLLVLDNCEHVLDAVADLVDGLPAGGSTVLATSREPLEVDREVVLVRGEAEHRTEEQQGRSGCDAGGKCSHFGPPTEPNRIASSCSQPATVAGGRGSPC